MKYEENHTLRRFEVRVDVQELLAVRSPQTSLMVTLSGEHHPSAIERMSNLLMEKRVLHSVVTHDGRKTIVAVDDMPSVWSSAVACGVTVNIHREKGPMSNFVLNELCCALVLLQLKASGSLCMGESGTFTMNNQLRPDEVQCIQIHELRLIGHHVVLSFSPVVYSMKTADMFIRELRANTVGGTPATDDVVSRHVVTNNLLYAVPGMTECRVLQFSSHLPPPSSLANAKFAPQNEAEYRSHWKAVHRMDLPQDFGGYLRVQFASGDELTYPASCISTNFHVLHKQSRLEAQDIARMLFLTLKAGFGRAAVVMHDETRESKTAQLLPASALIEPSSFENGMHVVRKRGDDIFHDNAKRKKGC